MFNLIGVGERAGSGIEKIQKAWNDENWISPQLDENFAPDRVELLLKMENNNVADNIENNTNTIVDNLSNIDNKVNNREILNDVFLSSFTDDEIKVLALASVNGSVNNAIVQNLLGKNSKEVHSILKALVKRKVLETSGLGRGVEYKLNKNIKNIIDSKNFDFNKLEKNSLSDEQLKVIELINENGFISSKIATDRLGISKRKSVIIFNSLIDKGIIDRIGAGSSTRYVLKEENKK